MVGTVLYLAARITYSVYYTLPAQPAKYSILSGKYTILSGKYRFPCNAQYTFAYTSKCILDIRTSSFLRIYSEPYISTFSWTNTNTILSELDAIRTLQLVTRTVPVTTIGPVAIIPQIII